MDELNALKCENQELRCQVDKLKDELCKCEIESKQSHETIVGQNAHIKFLEGQIEAYQYCMNCRR